MNFEDALQALGELLAEEGLAADLVLVGGGALLLRGELQRPTADLDVVARVENGTLQASAPLPAALIECVRRVGRALDLPFCPRDSKDWLNAGPSYLTTMGLPEGFEGRLERRAYGPLTIRIASRLDLIAFKIFAASDPQRSRRAVDVADLKLLAPTFKEVVHALRWCVRVDGRANFLELDATPLLTILGFDLVSLLTALDHEVG